MYDSSLLAEVYEFSRGELDSIVGDDDARKSVSGEEDMRFS